MIVEGPFQNVVLINSLSIGLSGTATASIDEGDIVSGGKTIILTITGYDIWKDVGFDDTRQSIIDGINSNFSESTGWNSEVRDNLAVTAVVRTSDKIVTITLSAQGRYAITADETITATVPASSLESISAAVVASPTITIDDVVSAPQYLATIISPTFPRYMTCAPDSNSPSNDGLITLSWITGSLVLDMTDATLNGTTANSIEKIFTYSGGNVQVAGYPGDEYGQPSFADVYFYDILEQSDGVFAAEGFIASYVVVL